VKIFNESACVDKVPKFNNPKGVLCAGGEVDQDTCTGDSGGPLAGPIWVNKGWRKKSYQWQLYGLTSIGSPNCNTLSFDRQPAVYTDVAYFSDWVKKQTQNCCR
jgi:secreted trypsin-like serine protease